MPLTLIAAQAAIRRSRRSGSTDDHVVDGGLLDDRQDQTVADAASPRTPATSGSRPRRGRAAPRTTATIANQTAGGVAEAGQRGERGDARSSSRDVDRVGAERRHRGQQPAERQRGRAMTIDVKHHDQGEDEEARVRPAALVMPEERPRPIRSMLSVERERPDERDASPAGRARTATAGCVAGRARTGSRRRSRGSSPSGGSSGRSRCKTTFAGIQRIRSSSTNRTSALVRNSWTRGCRRGRRRAGGSAREPSDTGRLRDVDVREVQQRVSSMVRWVRS